MKSNNHKCFKNIIVIESAHVFASALPKRKIHFSLLGEPYIKIYKENFYIKRLDKTGWLYMNKYNKKNVWHLNGYVELDNL